MAKLTGIEKRKLEKLLEMGGGYVLDFSNRTLQEFIFDDTGLDIYDDKYNYASGSKANRLRAFWEQESNYVVGKLIADLLECWRTQRIMSGSNITSSEQALYEECLKVSEKLKQDSAVENIDAIHPTTDDKDFALLAKSIRESVTRNEPEGALDRLHTFTVRYIRELCDKHSIAYGKNTPLHSLFGGYIKCLRENNIIESEMTERILKSSISVLEAFNNVRNNQSFAHDNPILNYHESILILNDISNVIKFIESIELKQEARQRKPKGEVPWEDIPF
jgi:hypothetical protein